MGVSGEGRQSLGHDSHPYGCTHTARGSSLNYHAQQTPAGSTEQNQQASNEVKQCPQLTTQKEKPQNTKHCAQHMLLKVTLRKAEGEKARQKGISRKEARKHGRKEGRKDTFACLHCPVMAHEGMATTYILRGHVTIGAIPAGSPGQKTRASFGRVAQHCEIKHPGAYPRVGRGRRGRGITLGLRYFCERRP